MPEIEINNDPSVNIPENVLNRPESLSVLFLRAGHYVAVGGQDLMLYQAQEGQVALGIRDGKTFRAFVLFPGTLTLDVPKPLIEVPAS
jgi:hypothetical protein